MDIENARVHEIYWNMGSIAAAVGLYLTAWLNPAYASIVLPLGIGSSLGIIGHTIAI